MNINFTIQDSALVAVAVHAPNALYKLKSSDLHYISAVHCK